MIKLNDNYFIESDGTNYILKQTVERINKDTKESYDSEVPLGYYGAELDQALRGYVRKSMLNKTMEQDLTLKQVLDMCERIERRN